MVTRKPAWSLVLMALLVFLSASVFKSSGQDRATGVKPHEDWSGVCSVATTQGTYGVWEEGQNPPGTPVVIVGSVTFDGAGNMSGTWSGSFGGNVVPPTPFTGTYTVSPDCTYSDEFSPFPNNPSVVFHHWGTIIGHGKEAHYIYSDAGTVISGTAKKSR